MNDIGQEIEGLRRLPVRDLRERYATLFGDAANTGNKAWLVKRLAWRMQSQAEGGLSERAQRRAAELANEADLRLSPPKAKPVPQDAAVVHIAVASLADRRLPPPGTILQREYKGGLVRVTVLPQGFEHGGQVFRSLSSVAAAITGTHVNGYQFFRLGDAGGAA